MDKRTKEVMSKRCFSIFQWVARFGAVDTFFFSSLPSIRYGGREEVGGRGVEASVLSLVVLLGSWLR